MIVKYTLLIFLVIFLNLISRSHSQNEGSSVPATQTCHPIPASALKIKKTGNKAADKCIDWEELIYPCVNSSDFVPGALKIREDQCSHNVVSLLPETITGKDEFPHVAFLGFDSDTGDILWVCGGTLISERWIMTAAHCTWLRQTNTGVKYAKLGSNDEGVASDPELMHTIEKIVLHPSYVGTLVYNDIALLKLDRNAKFSKSVIPACLHTDPSNDNIEKFFESGWGYIEADGERKRKLIKVTLQKFNYTECSIGYPVTRRLPDGVRDATQLCAGHRTEAKDSCLGEFQGGPLQIYNMDVYCTYTVVGIVSTGKVCGLTGLPALYTRVSAFIPWIESVVWP